MEKGIGFRYKVLRNLYPHANGLKRYWLMLFILSLATVGLEFITPFFYKLFIDDVVLQADFSRMLVVIIGYLTTYFLGITIGYMQNFAKNTLVNGTTYNIRKQMLRNFFSLPFQDYENSSIGDMKMRIDDDTNQLNEFAGSQTVDYIMAGVSLMISMIMLVHINWILAIYSVTLIPLTFWLDNMISSREKIIVDKRRENNQERDSWQHDSIQGWREVKALNFAKHETRRYYDYLHKDMIYNVKWMNFWITRVRIIPRIKNECFMQFGLYFLGGLLIMSGKLEISDLLIFSAYFSILSEAVQKVSTADADLQSNMPHIERLLESLTSSVHNVGSKKVPDDTHTIELTDVSFVYPDSEKKVLENFNLVINKGERIAITGKSGSGKTTLLKLIMGMLTPTCGQVSFCGINLQDINIDEMHSRMGFVMQENILFNTTIRENLLYGKENATEGELLEACKKACIYEFVTVLPNGLDTVIGEKGVKLSGGQRQRIVLARMFLKDIDIFIFDEATSALDQYSESIVQDAISSISRDKTVIIVAHRESSIKICDRVVEVSKGIVNYMQ